MIVVAAVTLSDLDYEILNKLSDTVKTLSLAVFGGGTPGSILQYTV